MGLGHVRRGELISFLILICGEEWKDKMEIGSFFQFLKIPYVYDHLLFNCEHKIVPFHFPLIRFFRSCFHSTSFKEFCSLKSMAV